MSLEKKTFSKHRFDKRRQVFLFKKEKKNNKKLSCVAIAVCGLLALGRGRGGRP